MAKRSRETFPCPHCGEPVPMGAQACPHCGADEQTGWAEDAEYAALDLPSGYQDDEDDEDVYKEDEQKSSGLPLWAKIALIVMCIVFAFLAILTH